METRRRRVASAFVAALAVTTLGVAPAGATTLPAPTGPAVTGAPAMCNPTQDPAIADELEKLEEEIARLNALIADKEIELGQRMMNAVILRSRINYYSSRLALEPGHPDSRQWHDQWIYYTDALRVENEIIAALNAELTNLVRTQFRLLVEFLERLLATPSSQAQPSMFCEDDPSWPFSKP